MRNPLRAGYFQTREISNARFRDSIPGPRDGQGVRFTGPWRKISARGFTLLEVMIAMAILAIALVTVYQSQSQSVSMAGDSRFLTTASLLAQGRMAEIDAADPREIATGSGDFGEAFPDYQWKVEIGDTEIDILKKVTLTVTNNRMVARNTYRLVVYKVVL
ncbi:MAG: type II secretion system minor pseudopilin GspI [Deltaproteobacteria bacterium]|nr:type II secretion system minor pseudopilin GspI [Deltaproteobacteria bacterium]